MISIPADEDHIVILRRTEGQCNYGLAYLTHPIQLSDLELIERAKNMEDDAKTSFGESGAYFKLLQEDQTFVFHVVNEDKATIKTLFQLELENLYIDGEPQGATEFTFELAAGESDNKFLKPIRIDEGTGLQMQYQCSIIPRSARKRWASEIVTASFVMPIK